MRVCVLRIRIVVDTTLPFTEFDDPNIDKEAIILGLHLHLRVQERGVLV